jgi:hypothetical protein
MVIPRYRAVTISFIPFPVIGWSGIHHIWDRPTTPSLNSGPCAVERGNKCLGVGNVTLISLLFSCPPESTDGTENVYRGAHSVLRRIPGFPVVLGCQDLSRGLVECSISYKSAAYCDCPGWFARVSFASDPGCPGIASPVACPTGWRATYPPDQSLALQR